jgi:hypothetical protein
MFRIEQILYDALVAPWICFYNLLKWLFEWVEEK